MLLNALTKNEADRERIMTAATADIILINESWRKFLLIICRAPVTSIITTTVKRIKVKTMAITIAASSKVRVKDL